MNPWDAKFDALAHRPSNFFTRPRPRAPSARAIAATPPPSGANAHERFIARCRSRKAEFWAHLYATDPSIANCLGHSGRMKRCFPDWIAALAAAVSLHRDKPSREIRWPYRCRKGHIHIGSLPDPSRMLTGGRA